MVSYLLFACIRNHEATCYYILKSTLQLPGKTKLNRHVQTKFTQSVDCCDKVDVV